MYGGGYIYREPLDDQQEDEQKLKEFQARIDRGEKIEPHDWMPEEYRRQLIRMIEQHANSEIVGALPEGTWITRAPGFKRKLSIIAKVQDEIGHGQLLYSAAETLGKRREEMINDLLEGKTKYSNVFNYPAKTWADATVIGFLVDGAAIVNQVTNESGSYGPYSRALKRINKEETFHLRQGYDAFVALATGTEEQREMLQDALNRWWEPIMHFFGPPDKQSEHTEKLMRWRIKLASNDEMRQKFLDQYVPKVRELDLELPDPKLQKNEETGKWEYTEPDWDRFFEVIKGNGPCNDERMRVRRWAEEHGRWVREALMQKSHKEETVPLA